jgi:sugar O-acyltransferase (sialic acid O-acetyltransferase NeuD family)
MREKPQVLIVGAGGHAKVVISTLLAAGRNVCAVVDDDAGLHGTYILGVRIVGSLAAAEQYSDAEAIVAIGDNRTRRSVVERLPLRWTNAIHPSAIVHPSVQLGLGTVVFAGAVVQPDARIGSHAIVNTAATVDHDCSVGNFVHLAPGTHLGGNISVGEGAFLGVAIPWSSGGCAAESRRWRMERFGWRRGCGTGRSCRHDRGRYPGPAAAEGSRPAFRQVRRVEGSYHDRTGRSALAHGSRTRETRFLPLPGICEPLCQV